MNIVILDTQNDYEHIVPTKMTLDKLNSIALA